MFSFAPKLIAVISTVKSHTINVRIVGKTKIEYMRVLRKTETFNALKAIDILSKAPVRSNGALWRAQDTTIICLGCEDL